METGKAPSDEELATRLNISIDKLRMVLRSARHTVSTSEPIKVRGAVWGGRGVGASQCGLNQMLTLIL